MGEGRFRSDLLARINLWDFQLPGLADRREDIEPNLEYELQRFAEKSGKHITFNKEARQIFMDFALDPGTLWRGNFRDLNAMSTRMATLSSGGRIDENVVRRKPEKNCLPYHGNCAIPPTIPTVRASIWTGSGLHLPGVRRREDAKKNAAAFLQLRSVSDI